MGVHSAACSGVSLGGYCGNSPQLLMVPSGLLSREGLFGVLEASESESHLGRVFTGIRRRIWLVAGKSDRGKGDIVFT